ncbi:MAG: sarcosine oxidase subunit delta [Pseudomonadota bacterium]
MLRIYCPYCQEAREEVEFHYAGQAHIVRPLDPEACSDEAWGRYLYFRKNTAGREAEMWVHGAGCRKFFNVLRNTVSYEIERTYPMGEHPEDSTGERPEVDGGGA